MRTRIRCVRCESYPAFEGEEDGSMQPDGTAVHSVPDAIDRRASLCFGATSPCRLGAGARRPSGESLSVCCGHPAGRPAIRVGCFWPPAANLLWFTPQGHRARRLHVSAWSAWPAWPTRAVPRAQQNRGAGLRPRQTSRLTPRVPAPPPSLPPEVMVPFRTTGRRPGVTWTAAVLLPGLLWPLSELRVHWGTLRRDGVGAGDPPGTGTPESPSLCS